MKDFDLCTGLIRQPKMLARWEDTGVTGEMIILNKTLDDRGLRDGTLQLTCISRDPPLKWVYYLNKLFDAQEKRL